MTTFGENVRKRRLELGMIGMLVLAACSVGGEFAFRGIWECYGSEFDERTAVRFNGDAETTSVRVYYGAHEPYGIIRVFDMNSKRMVSLRTDNTYPNNLEFHCREIEGAEL